MISLPSGLILGHRGAPAAHPENTLRSFREALAQGAAGVELDVQPGADGVPVVIHDANLERTTNGSSPVASCRWQDLARLDAHRFLLADRCDAAARAHRASCAAQGVCLADAAATPTALAELAAARFPVVVWTVDDPARMRELLAAGAMAIITNYPDRAARARQSLRR